MWVLKVYSAWFYFSHNFQTVIFLSNEYYPLTLTIMTTEADFIWYNEQKYLGLQEFINLQLNNYSF